MCVCVCVERGFKNKSAKHRNIYIKKYVVCLTSKSVVYFCFRALDAKESKSTKQATYESRCCCYVAKLKKRQKKKLFSDISYAEWKARVHDGNKGLFDPLNKESDSFTFAYSAVPAQVVR